MKRISSQRSFDAAMLFSSLECRIGETFASRDPLLLLAFHRLHFLAWQERLLLFAQVRDRQDFLALGLDEIARLLYRRLQPRVLDMGRIWAHAEIDAQMLDMLHARFVCVTESEYPALLREIYRAPFGLFVRGSGRLGMRPAITMVGTRTPTAVGIKAAASLAGEAAAAGFCIVSGLARGIDAAAHRGALHRKAEGGPTLAVLPCGIDRIYPPSNRGLAAGILDSGGLLVSEYPPGVNLEIYRFPERNRILAGMSALTVVVEAPEKSGALITSEFALAEGREVAVAAACRKSSRNAGGDALAEDGAPEIRNAEDMRALMQMHIENSTAEDAVFPEGASIHGSE